MAFQQPQQAHAHSMGMVDKADETRMRELTHEYLGFFDDGVSALFPLFHAIFLIFLSAMQKVKKNGAIALWVSNRRLGIQSILSKGPPFINVEKEKGEPLPKIDWIPKRRSIPKVQ
jgi:hypothetical protein